MQLTYIKIFVDCLESIEPLDDAERGRLFTALLEYAKTGEKPVLQGNERFLFPTLRAQLDRDAASYESLCEMNSRKGALGGRPSKKAAAFSESRKSQEEDKEKDKEKEKEKDQYFSGRTSGPQDRSLGRGPNAGYQREKSFSRREVKRDPPEMIRKDMERMRKFMLELRREAEEQDRREAEQAACGQTEIS